MIRLKLRTRKSLRFKTEEVKVSYISENGHRFKNSHSADHLVTNLRLPSTRIQNIFHSYGIAYILISLFAINFLSQMYMRSTVG